MKFFLLTIALVGVVGGNLNDLRIIDSIILEDSCRKSGGMCVIESDCPEDYTGERGLCPLQQDQGIECCSSMSVKETRCGKRGGVCTSEFCGKVAIYEEATDCPYGTKCCILS